MSETPHARVSGRSSPQLYPRWSKTYTATLIIADAQVVTMLGPDDVREAIALAGDRILAVGISAEMLGLADDTTEIVDLAGRA